MTVSNGSTDDRINAVADKVGRSVAYWVFAAAILVALSARSRRKAAEKARSDGERPAA